MGSWERPQRPVALWAVLFLGSPHYQLLTSQRGSKERRVLAEYMALTTSNGTRVGGHVSTWLQKANVRVPLLGSLGHKFYLQGLLLTQEAWMTGAAGGADVMYNPIQKCNQFTQRYIHDQYKNILKQKYNKCMSCRTASNEAGRQVLTTSLKFILSLLPASRVSVMSLAT